MIKNNSAVQVKMPIIHGIVQKTLWDEGNDCKIYLIAYNDADGVCHERWYDESDLIEVV